VAVERTRRIHFTARESAVLGEVSKESVGRYYEAVGKSVLSLLRGRACRFLRPDGTALAPPPWTPKFVARTDVPHAPFCVDSVDTLLFAVEAGAPIVEASEKLAFRVPTADEARHLRSLAEELGTTALPIALGDAIEVRIALGELPPPVVALVGDVLGLVLAKRGVAFQRTSFIATPLAPQRADGTRIVVATPTTWDAPGAAEDADVAIGAQGAWVERVRALELMPFDEAALARAVEAFAVRFG
jgi:hypothetical protein